MSADLSLTVALRILWGGELMGYLVFGIEAYHLFAGKVRPVVGDDGMRESKATYNVLLEKFNYLLSRASKSSTAYTHLVK